MPPAQLEKSEATGLQLFADAVHALSDEPTKANVERYLAESSALEQHRRSACTPRERRTHMRKSRS